MSDIIQTRQIDEPEYRQAAPDTERRTLTDAMIAQLNRASPWLRFVGILGFIQAGSVFLSGLVSVVIAAVWGGDFGFGDLGFWDEIMPSNLGLLWGAIQIAIGVFVLMPAIFAFRFGAKIRSHAVSGRSADLESAFGNNASLWKFYGILCIVAIALTIVGIVVVVVGGAALAFSELL